MLKNTLIIIFLIITNITKNAILNTTVILKTPKDLKNQKNQFVCKNIFYYKIKNPEKIPKNKFFFSLFCKTIEKSCCSESQFKEIYINFKEGIKKLTNFKSNLYKIISYFKFINQMTFKNTYEIKNKNMLKICNADFKNLNFLSYYNIINLEVLPKKIEEIFNDVIKYYSGFGCQLCENYITNFITNNSKNDFFPLIKKKNFSKTEKFESVKYEMDFKRENLEFFFSIYDNYFEIINYFKNLAKLSEIGFCLQNKKSSHLKKILNFDINSQMNIHICKNLLQNGYDKKCILFFSETFGFFDTFKGFKNYENSFIDIYKGLKFLNNDFKYKQIHIEKQLPIYFFGVEKNFDFFDIKVNLIDKKGWSQFKKGNKHIVEEILNNAKVDSKVGFRGNEEREWVLKVFLCVFGVFFLG